ncbi:GFA family protein [Nevskia sp.]|uniref:GFA family protein n=1 Tax=Nevskia sp. TaxID=1929292 RepID=UPI0025F4F487|nr:GFA family protein [Nevskia sp.]
MSEPVLHHGGCHCGAVRYTVRAPARITAQSCNCSMCARTGFLHLIVPAAAFTLDAGGDMLSEYTFNTGVARHRFCKRCGVKSFYVPRSNPDGYSINVHCLDPGTVEALTVEAFDGQNWEANAAALAHLST